MKQFVTFRDTARRLGGGIVDRRPQICISDQKMCTTIFYSSLPQYLQSKSRIKVNISNDLFAPKLSNFTIQFFECYIKPTQLK
jgi:hypothetical protein